MTAVHRRMLVALCAALALVFATGANAAIVTSHDDQGRQITFDVRAPNVDTEWYASILRASAHGNEISDVTIRIVPESADPGALRWRRRFRVLHGPVGPADDHDRRRQEQNYRRHAAARVRPSPRHVLARLRRSRAERHAGVVGGTGHGGAACAASGRVRLLARLEPRHRRDLRGGLLLHPHRRPLRDHAGCPRPTRP